MTQLGRQPGIDFEVYGKGPWSWVMYYKAGCGSTRLGLDYQDKVLDEGSCRTRLGLAVALWRRKLMFNASIGEPAAIVRAMR